MHCGALAHVALLSGIQHIDVGARRILRTAIGPCARARRRAALRPKSPLSASSRPQLLWTRAASSCARCRSAASAGCSAMRRLAQPLAILPTLPKLVLSSHACAGDSKRRWPAAGRGSLQALRQPRHVRPPRRARWRFRCARSAYRTLHRRIALPAAPAPTSIPAAPAIRSPRQARCAPSAWPGSRHRSPETRAREYPMARPKRRKIS